MELAAGGGLHVSDIQIDLDAEVTSSGVSAADEDTALPLPVLGFKLNYSVNPRFSWFVQSQIFSIQIGDWDGTYLDSQIGAEFRAFDNLGFGIGLGSSALNVKEESQHRRFEFRNRLSGEIE